MRTQAIRVIFVFCLLSLHFRDGVVCAEPPAPEKFKIGVIYAFTGPAQAFSDYGRMGLELARDEINAAGGIHGKPVEFVFEDSQTSPAQSVAAYHKLVSVQQLNIIFGDVWAFITNPLIPLAAKDKVLLVSPTVMPESVERTSSHFFSLGEHIANIRPAVEKFFKTNPNIHRVGILCWEDSWGQAYLKVWKEVAERNGVTIAAEICSIDFANDYATDVAKLKARKVDAVIIPHFGDRILKRMQEQHLNAVVLGTGNIIEDIKLKKAPASLFEGVYLTEWRPNQEFVEKFLKKFGKEPLMYAHDSYETMRSVAMALKSGDADIHHALRSIRYQGSVGEVDFSNSAFGNQGVAQLYRVHNGEPKLVQ